MKIQTQMQRSEPKIEKVKGLPVFVVEDNPTYSFMLTYNLEQEFNFNISNFASGEDCLLNLEQLRPAIIILDYKLKNMDGGTVLQFVKHRYPEIYVIVLTEQKNFQTAIDIMKKGAFDYLQKSKTALDELIGVIYKVFNDMELCKQKKLN